MIFTFKLRQPKTYSRVRRFRNFTKGAINRAALKIREVAEIILAAETAQG